MTWQEFKQKAEALGVRNPDNISWITVITDVHGNSEFACVKNNNEWEIDDDAVVKENDDK